LDLRAQETALDPDHARQDAGPPARLGTTGLVHLIPTTTPNKSNEAGVLEVDPAAALAAIVEAVAALGATTIEGATQRLHDAHAATAAAGRDLVRPDTIEKISTVPNVVRVLGGK
jgi:hypothetical protein